MMIRPHVPDLTVAEESVAIENAHILKANCFEFRVNQDGPPGKRIQVVSQPMSDSKVFSSTGKVYSLLFQTCISSPISRFRFQ